MDEQEDIRVLGEGSPPATTPRRRRRTVQPNLVSDATSELIDSSQTELRNNGNDPDTPQKPIRRRKKLQLQPLNTHGEDEVARNRNTMNQNENENATEMQEMQEMQDRTDPSLNDASENPDQQQNHPQEETNSKEADTNAEGMAEGQDDEGGQQNDDEEPAEQPPVKEKKKKKPAQVIFVESMLIVPSSLTSSDAATGRFSKISSKEKKSKKKVVDEEFPQTESGIFSLFLKYLSTVFAIIFFQCQGLLAGVSLLMIFLSYGGGESYNNVKFLDYYSKIASNTQHIYFFLTCIAVVGALERMARNKVIVWTLGPEGANQKIIDIAILISFLFSLLNAQMDEKIHYADRRVEGWYRVQDLSSTFEGELVMWHVFNIIRIIACLIGWLLVGFDLRDALAPRPIIVEDVDLLDTSTANLQSTMNNSTLGITTDAQL